MGYVQDSVFSLAYALDRIINNCSSIQFGNYCNLAEVSGSQIFDVMVAFPISGLTGSIRFSGIDRIGGSFDVIQVDDSGRVRIVGSYSNDTLTLNEGELKFKGTGVPTSNIVLDNTSETSVVGVIVITVSFLSILLCCFTSFYLYKHRRNKIIKKSSPTFCQLMLFGMVLVYIGLVLWTVDQTQLICILKIWTVIIGFGLIIGNLLAKTYRIFKIFNNIKVTTTAIRDRNILECSFAILLMEILLLSIYTFVEGLPNPTVVISSTDPLYSYVVCEVGDDDFQTAMTIVIVIFNVILVLCAGVIAFLTRHVDSAYSESNYVGYTVYCYIILAIITFPLYFTGGDGTGSATRRYIERSLSLLLAMSFTWLALFAPKLRTIYQEKKLASERSISFSSRIYTDQTSGPRLFISEPRGTDTGARAHSDYVTFGKRFITAPLWKNRAVARRVTSTYFPIQAATSAEPSSTSFIPSTDMLDPTNDTSSRLNSTFTTQSLATAESLTEGPIEGVPSFSPDWILSEPYTLALIEEKSGSEEDPL